MCQHQRTKKRDKVDKKLDKRENMLARDEMHTKAPSSIFLLPGCSTGTAVHCIDCTRIYPELI